MLFVDEMIDSSSAVLISILLLNGVAATTAVHVGISDERRTAA